MNDSATNDRADPVHVATRPRGSWSLRLKRLMQFFFGLLVLPRQLIMKIMQRVVGREAFRYAAESIAGVPGLRGVYMRQRFYSWNLRSCGRDVNFGWNSVFSMNEAEVGHRAYIGRCCSIGFAKIGEEVMLADHVQILSGGNEHGRGDDGETMQAQAQTYRQVCVGRGAWIGAGAIVMADVGEGAVVGAGAVVKKPIPPHCVAVGVPARVVRHGDSTANPTSEATPAVSRRPVTSESN